jgi:glyoxylase-like metal-dependent hydrolase (beta-lactamase superfamily II)
VIRALAFALARILAFTLLGFSVLGSCSGSVRCSAFGFDVRSSTALPTLTAIPNLHPRAPNLPPRTGNESGTRTGNRGPGSLNASGAQVPPPTDLRLYIFDCGTLKDRDAVAYGLSLDQVPPRDLADLCALVVHPRGTLLWETGLHESVNDVKPGGDTRPGRPRAGDHVDASLRSQLQRAGYAPDAITYVALSHAHWDHTGNLRDFIDSSTWLVQRAERESIFGAAAPPNQPDFAGVERMKVQVLEGDHDVFGDGRVRLLFAPGHTPGHQVLLVDLPRTGAVLLSGDLYHFAEELTLKAAPAGRNAAQVAGSKAKVQDVLAKTGGQLWIQHDRNHFAKLRKAPAFYE